MSEFFRRRVEATIEHLIEVLDELDGDADLETEPAEEQHDGEDDPAENGIVDRASLAFVLARISRSRSKGRC